MSRDVRLWLGDIVQAAGRVERYVQGMSLEQFVSDERTFDAVVRNLEVMGEAAKRVPQDVREALPGIEWRKVAALRDVLAHGYFGLEPETLWEVIRDRVPEIRLRLEEALRDWATGEPGRGSEG